MQIVKIKERLTLEEKEVLLLYDAVDKQWTMDTTVMKYYNKAKKQGWTQTKEFVYDDGTICGGVFVAPDRAVTIRNVDPKQMSDKQMENLLQDEDDEL
jgi:hypothetical protein